MRQRRLVMIPCILLCATLSAQAWPSFLDLVPELAARVAALLPPGSEATVKSAASDPDETSIPELQREIVRLLTSRSIRVVAGDATATQAVITVGCGQNLRERACVAEVRRGDKREIVTATKPHEPGISTDSPEPHRALAVEAVPLFSQATPILDAILVDDRLLVLDRTSLTMYRRTGEDWQRLDSRPIQTATPWPRDLRGRLHLTTTGVEAFLPGVVCRAPADIATVTCANEREPWPLGLENNGLDALRNSFQTPEGMPFLSVASIDGSSDIRAVVVDGSGNLVLLDHSRKRIDAVGTADEVASVSSPCNARPYILTAAMTAPGARTDAVQLSQVAGRRIVAAATTIALPGRITALWAAQGATVAMAVVKDVRQDTERYEAFQIRVSCNR